MDIGEASLILQKILKLDNQIRRAITIIYGEKFHPKDEQVASIRQLIYKSTDVVLITPPGFGKSLVMQAISILRKDTTSIIFLPLNKIAKRRSQEANQIGGRGILFHGKIKDMREEIQLVITRTYS